MARLVGKPDVRLTDSSCQSKHHLRPARKVKGFGMFSVFNGLSRERRNLSGGAHLPVGGGREHAGEQLEKA
jgi:hypothetical protein